MGSLVRFTPSRWGATGEAEGTFRNQVVSVFGGIPGEDAIVKVVAQGAHKVAATWRSTQLPSPRRVDVRCGRYHLCGGCPMMHVDAAGQEGAHRDRVRDALDREGLTDVQLGRFVASPDGLDDFRHVVKLGVGFSERGALRVGAWGRATRTVVPIPECNVATPALRTLMGTVAHHVRKLDIRPFDPLTGKGVLRAIILRQSASKGDLLVTLVAGKRLPLLDQLANAIRSEVREVMGVALHLNEDEGNAIFSRDEETGRIGITMLDGRSYIEEEIDGIVHHIGPADFFQTNPRLAAALWRDALGQMALQPDEPVVDLYCGVGTITLAAAQRTGWALGIEEVSSATEAAADTARRHGLRAEFLTGRVAEVLEEASPRLSDLRPVVLVNPARRGLEEGVLEQITELRPRRIGYISCHPKALARDLAKFRAAGLTIGEITLYDMFPNTAHVECFVEIRDPSADGLVRRAPRRSRPGGQP
jgi:23S rRNA (uracil1939-C5)-methyltransferase